MGKVRARADFVLLVEPDSLPVSLVPSLELNPQLSIFIRRDRNHTRHETKAKMDQIGQSERGLNGTFIKGKLSFFR